MKAVALGAVYTSMKTAYLWGGIVLALSGLAFARVDTKKTNPERQVADLLDSLIQPRFQVTNGKDFGMSRVVPVRQGHGHMGVLQPETEAEKKILAEVAQSGYEYKLGFVHTGYQLSRYARKLPTYPTTPTFERIWRDNQDYNDSDASARDDAGKAVLAALEKRPSGKEIETHSGTWAVFARPVLAQKESCASCHANAKVGQPMGAMVYLVRSLKLSERTVR